MNVIIGNAWPYANGPLHLGRIAVLLPGDILARYHRLMGDDVVFVSGTDCHGTPVKMKAIEEGLKPIEIVEKYHENFKKCFENLGFSFDIFAKTHFSYHENKVKEFILQLINSGYIYEKEVEQIYCENCNEILTDRYIEGKCPHCDGYATGDQCTECGEICEADELVDKKCKVCKCEPKVKDTKHLYFKLSKFENDVKRLFIRQQGWRENAQKIVKRYLDEGLRDRAVTRDFDWGVDVPLQGYKDKKIYVWIEAVMGYLTASMKIIEEREEDWKEYWSSEDSRVYFVHGKDNIPFHTVIFPSILAGLGVKNPNLRIISSEYLKLEGKNFSTVKNYAIWGDDIVKKYNPDVVRYYLTVNSPQYKDMDFTWRNFVNLNNSELVDSFGNLVNRTLMFVEKHYDGKVPNGKISDKIKDELFDLYFDVGDQIEAGCFREALDNIFKYIKKANRYFDNEKPWITIEKDSNKCRNDVYSFVQIVANISNLIEPFMPFTAEKIRRFIGISNKKWSYIEIKGNFLTDITMLFEKIERKAVQEEIINIKNNKI